MLNQFGWELVEKRTIANLWIAEIWMLKSVWSPTGCSVYLTFEIDSECDSRDVSRVWAAHPSLSRPYDWNTETVGSPEDGVVKRGPVGSFGIRKEKHLSALFAELANLRNAFLVNSK